MKGYITQSAEMPGGLHEVRDPRMGDRWERGLPEFALTILVSGEFDPAMMCGKLVDITLDESG